MKRIQKYFRAKDTPKRQTWRTKTTTTHEGYLREHLVACYETQVRAQIKARLQNTSRAEEEVKIRAEKDILKANVIDELLNHKINF